MLTFHPTSTVTVTDLFDFLHPVGDAITATPFLQHPDDFKQLTYLVLRQAAVGSSIIRTRQLDETALAISTSCCSRTDRSRSGISIKGSAQIPKDLLASSLIFPVDKPEGIAVLFLSRKIFLQQTG